MEESSKSFFDKKYLHGELTVKEETARVVVIAAAFYGTTLGFAGLVYGGVKVWLWRKERKAEQDRRDDQKY